MPKIKRHQVIQPEDQSIKLIALTRGLTATVDAGDYERLMGHSWCVVASPNGKHFYPFTNLRQCDGTFRGIKMHHMVTGEKWVDHASGNTLDNRRSNLRKATPAQNAMNKRMRTDNRAGIKGVSWYPRYEMWVARIQVGPKRVCLGYFRDKDDAANAYRDAATKHYGEFARVA